MAILTGLLLQGASSQGLLWRFHLHHGGPGLGMAHQERLLQLEMIEVEVLSF